MILWFPLQETLQGTLPLATSVLAGPPCLFLTAGSNPTSAKGGKRFTCYIPFCHRAMKSTGDWPEQDYIFLRNMPQLSIEWFRASVRLSNREAAVCFPSNKSPLLRHREITALFTHHQSNSSCDDWLGS